MLSTVSIVLSVLLVLPSVYCQSEMYTSTLVTNPDSSEQGNVLIREPTPYDVYTQHVSHLNACNWTGLMTQFPEQAEMLLGREIFVHGRKQIGDFWAGFVLPREEGGLCTLTFTEISRWQAGSTLNVKWIADAPFLARPYYGADAFVTDDGLMVSIVSTFDGADLEFVGEANYTVKAVKNMNTGETSSILKKENTPKQVADAHLRTLNNCDWKGLVTQYPDQAEIHLPNGVLLKGREQIGEFFGEYVKSKKDGGFCGLKFKITRSFEVADVVNVRWEADADFLRVPYNGSDAYVTDNGLMAAIVTTFNADELEYK